MGYGLKAKLLLVVFVAGGIFIGVGASPASVAFACPAGYYSCTLEKSVTTYVDIYESGCNC